MNEKMNEKKHKKRALLVAILVVAAVVTSALIVTLAKYVTSGTVADEAVTAKFGLDIPNEIDLFADSYTGVEADVQDKKIIAPGTSGHYAFEVTGTSEVAYKVSADIRVAYSAEWGDYAPLEFSLDEETWFGLDAFKQELATKLASERMEPNATYTGAQTIYWTWPFFVSEEFDELDTALGIAAAEEEGTAPGVTVSIIVTAEQVI